MAHYPIEFQLSLTDSDNPDVVADVFEALVMALATANYHYLVGTPNFPLLYRSGVRYRRETNRELFQDCKRVLEAGFADCEDLAAWRIAEFWAQGLYAEPYITYQRWYERGELRYEYHVQVRHLWGVEDPSAALGMR